MTDEDNSTISQFPQGTWDCFAGSCLLQSVKGMSQRVRTSKLAEHGGFAHDDTNVILLLSNPSFHPHTIRAGVGAVQVGPTILKPLGIDPRTLDAVRVEGTSVLPAVQLQEPAHKNQVNRQQTIHSASAVLLN